MTLQEITRAWAVELAGRIERTTGFALEVGDLERRLGPLAAVRAHDLGLASGEEYLVGLAAAPTGGPEWSRLIEHLSNGHTSFFRDAEQLAVLGEELVRLSRVACSRPLEVWSAGCSSGEEPYSVAILCAELNVRASIRATDINRRLLAAAEEGVYDAWALRRASHRRLERFLEPVGRRYRVNDAIRQTIRFARHNLVLEEPPLPASRDRWDVILCRNVFLYFGSQQVASTCRRLARVLSPDGLLVISASESLHGLEVPLEPLQIGSRIFYRRRSGVARGRTVGPGPRTPVSRPRSGADDLPAAPVQAPAQETVLDQVIALAVNGSFSEAHARLEEHLRGDAGEPMAHLVLGHLYLRRHDFAPALAAYEHAASSDPLWCESHFFVGLVCRKAGWWAEAEVALRRCLFLAPAFWQASLLLAGVLERRGNLRGAAREKRRALRLLRDNPDAVVFLSPAVFVDEFDLSAEAAGLDASG